MHEVDPSMTAPTIKTTDWHQMLNQLITSLYSGILLNQPWRGFIEQLRVFTDCDLAGLTLRPAQENQASISIWDCRQPLAESALQNASELRMAHAHCDPLAMALKQSGDLFNLDEVIDRERLYQLPYYQHFIRRYDMEYQLGLCIGEPGGWRCQLGLINGHKRRNFNERDKQLLRDLHPHLEQALSIYATLQRQSLEKAVYALALEKLSIGTALLNTDGRILEISETAKSLIGRSHCMTLNNDYLTLSRPGDRSDFKQMVRAAAQWSQQNREGSYVDVISFQDSGYQRFGLLIRSAPVFPWFQNATTARVILYLSGFDQRSPPETVVGRLFDLTPSEALLATRLAEGFSLSAAAEDLGLTESSARTYCKRIFSKTGTNRQAELVRLILKSVAPLGIQETPPEEIYY